MRIALIDNGTRLQEQLEHHLSGHEVTELSYPEAARALSGFDAVILSGSSLSEVNPIIAKPNVVTDEIRLIQETNVPLLGICYGAELIAFSFRGKLTELPEIREGVHEITVTGTDPVLEGVPETFDAYEKHHWAVSELTESLTELAHSPTGIEIFRHKERPLYGVQFHPEKEVSEDALRVFRNFLTIAK